MFIDRRLDESRDAGGAGLGVFSSNNARWTVLVVGDDVVPHESSCFAHTQPCGHLEQGQVDAAAVNGNAVCQRVPASLGRYYTLGRVEGEQVGEHAVIFGCGERSPSLRARGLFDRP